MEKTYVTKCSQCGQNFERLFSHNIEIQTRKSLKVGVYRSGREFCNKECFSKFRTINKTVETKCGWCDQNVVRKLCEFNKSKSGLVFCCRSCSVSYNNTKKRNSRRSKCEKMLFDLLKECYPKLEFVANGKTMFNGLECDIEILSLKLAIEWNGIVHYKPIYGEEKLKKIQIIDEKKQNLAREKEIQLIVVPDLVSSKKYVKEVFHSICCIIDGLLN